MACKTTCCRCGDKFDRFSGKLINLSDEGLRSFYALDYIQKYVSEEGHKHPTLCLKCLQHLLGRGLKLSEIKFKNGRWMTSNVAMLVMTSNLSDEIKEDKIRMLKSLDSAGVLPYKHKTDDKRIVEDFLR